MATAARDLAPLHILVPEELKERLKLMADARERSVALETREAIKDRLKDFERQPSGAAS